MRVLTSKRNTEITLRKLILTLFLFAFSNQCLAEGPYDGIWYFQPYGYANISERNDIMVMMFFFTDDYGGDWDATLGLRIDNKATVSTVVSKGDAILDVTFTSNTTVFIKQISCSPLILFYECRFPDGFVMHGGKVW